MAASLPSEGCILVECDRSLGRARSDQQGLRVGVVTERAAALLRRTQGHREIRRLSARGVQVAGRVSLGVERHVGAEYEHERHLTYAHDAAGV